MTMAVVSSPFNVEVNRQRQPVGPPPRKDPPEQRSEAESYVQFGPAGTRPVAAVVQPPYNHSLRYCRRLFQSAPNGEGGRDGILAGAPGQDAPAHPPGQAGQLWLSEVR